MYNYTICCINWSRSTIDLLPAHEVTRNCILSPLSHPAIGDSAPSVCGMAPQRASCGASTWKLEAVAAAISQGATSTPPQLLDPLLAT